ncbi:protein asteroid homolog 1 [Mugil cephalus]|uniref:protein asteroid homolog 1 n=1 Tax=Mugil cephalus TaxID=48193 RepID=UPI001FB74170|nr:protein asteroid homolog 1 [Mugil cephalus]
MGVQGLVSFLERHGTVYRDDAEFRMSRLVIDGWNLVYLLYYRSGLDQNLGGEYAALEDLTERFVAALRTCGVTPYVVVDGGSDFANRKEETVLKRAEDATMRAHRAVVEGSREDILPQLAKRVFIQTLVRLDVPVARCFSEADQEIAALATEWRCPVLSEDSDFYIFDLPGGLLPIAHFQWQDVRRRGSYSYIPCRRFYTSAFCIVFSIQRRLLPTFAVLAGNDYVKQRKVRWAQFDPTGGDRPHRLMGLLHWLKDFNEPQDALKAALGLMGDLSETSKAELMKSLSLALDDYRLPPSYLKKFFIHGVAPPLPAEIKAVVPDWMRLPLARSELTTDVLDVLLMQRVSLSIVVEHRDLPPVSLTSRPIRQLIYGLLLGPDTSLQVMERTRDGLQLNYIPVKPTFTRVTERLRLSSLPQADASERLQVLLEALGVTQDQLSLLPPELRLPVAVTCYWMKRADPDVKLLKSLLLGMSNGAQTSSTAREAQNQLHQNLDVSVVHGLAQWQVCLKDATHLNQLLGFPLPPPTMARLYQGTLVHQLFHNRRLAEGLLEGDRPREKTYRDMLSTVLRVHHQEVSTESRDTSQPRRRPLGELMSNIQQEDEDTVKEELEELEEEVVSVKTRYRTKERRQRRIQPELTRKKERRHRDLL